MKSEIKEQINWIKSGKIGCVFASALVKNHNKIGWHFSLAEDQLIIPPDCFILSIIFPNKNIHYVTQWALHNGMYLESVHDFYNGLRIKQGSKISWVQYFGKDSHVKTRQSPHPMLSFCCSLPSKYYFKVGFEGILHLAHASTKFIKDKACDVLWNQSLIKTKKELGHSPSLENGEASKVTFKK